MDVSAIITEWGAVYRAGGQGMKDLMIKLREKSETEALFPLYPTENTVLDKATAESSKVLQRFQKAWTPKGNITFKPEKIPLYEQKIDVEEYPDDLEPTWLGFLADSNLDRKAWPFVKWWIENILAQASEDLEKDEIFGGVPGAITAGTATLPGTNMLGIRKQINDAVTAGKISPLVLGAVPTDPVDFVDYIEEMWSMIPHLLRPELSEFVMSRTLRDRYKTGMRRKYNVNYPQTNELAKIIDTDVAIVGVLSHEPSTKIWTTPKWNRVRGLKKPGNQQIMKLENVDRKVKAYTDFWKGVGYWIKQYVYTNDVDLT